jgi:DNA-binding beta-propeller fold protein YncE
VWRDDLGGSFWTSAVGNGTAWLGSAFIRQFTLEEGTSAGTITPIALATNATGDRVPVGGGPSGIAILGQGVYVSDLLGVVHPYVGGAVLKAIPVGDQATGIAAGGGFLWVSVNEP